MSLAAVGATVAGVVALAASTASAAAPATPLVAEDAAPFGHVGEITEHFYGVLGIVAIRGVHDRQRGTMDLEMRVTRAVPTPSPVSGRPGEQGSVFRLAMTASGANPRDDVRAYFRMEPGHPLSVGYSVAGVAAPGPQASSAFSFGSDRKAVRVHIADPRLRTLTYTRIAAGISARPYRDIGPGSEERVETFFNQSLGRLGARLRRGHLTVTSAAGAHVRVLIRKNESKPTVVRYRQTALGSSDRKLRYRFCPRRARYVVRIRARDRYGARRTLRFRPRRSSACVAPRRPPLIAEARDPFETRRATDPTQRRLRDIIGVRAEQNRQFGTMTFELRLARAVPRKPSRARFAFDATTRDGDDYVNAEIEISRRGASATYDLGNLDSRLNVGGKARLFISRDRKRLRMRVKNPMLSKHTYTTLTASDHTPSDYHNGEEDVEASFDLPLRPLRTRLRGGRLTIGSTQGARVTVLLRKDGGEPIRVRYRQRGQLGYWEHKPFDKDSDHGFATTLRYRFSCGTRGASYRASIRAWDRYGNRRRVTVQKRCR